MEMAAAVEKWIHNFSMHPKRSIHIVSCDKLVNLFTTCIVKSLVQLKKLRVLYCSVMQEIVMEEESEKGASAETSERIVFPNLYENTLRGLQVCRVCGWVTLTTPCSNSSMNRKGFRGKKHRRLED